MIIDCPVVLEAGDEWIPIAGRLDVVPGSALDFSTQFGPVRPAGDLGWLRVSPTQPSAFEFERDPGKPVRFYGVNLCANALLLTHEESDQLAERLMRRGYNCLRLHHHEKPLVDPVDPTALDFVPEQLDKLDCLFAALKRRGIYMETDLYVTRFMDHVLDPSALLDGADPKEKLTFKTVVHVSRLAIDNLKEFNRRLLNHVNPYTGLAYKDDPALAWIALINEPGLTQFIDKLKRQPAEERLWEAAFDEWKKANGVEGKWDGPEFHRFLWETHRKTSRKLISFLRDELKCRAPATDLNGFAGEWGAQACRTDFDYVDTHFYWDQSNDMSADGSGYPKRGGSGGGSSIRRGGVPTNGYLRLMDRPFVITELGYSAPNCYRSAGGMLAGAVAESGRLLLVHLTDVQSTGQRFRGKDLKARYEWGGVPRLARAGDAKVSLAHAAPGSLEVWRLDLAGNRVAKVAASVRGGKALDFEVSTAMDPASATLYYEIVRSEP